MKFGDRKTYSKGNRVWIKKYHACGVATIIDIGPIRRDAEGILLRGPRYIIQFDGSHTRWESDVQNLKPATELESQRSKDAAVDKHIKNIRAEGDKI